MSKAALHMSTSLDGFIAGPRRRPATGSVTVGTACHEWILTGTATSHRDIVDRLDGVNREVMDAAMRWPAVTYVRDVADAVHRAKDAAGDKDVLVHGGSHRCATASAAHDPWGHRFRPGTDL